MHENQIIRYMMSKKYTKDYDCWEFMRDVYRDTYNIELPEIPLLETPIEFKDKLVTNFKCQKVSDDDIKEGDMIIYSRFTYLHAGMMLDDKNFIHLGENNGVMITDKTNLRGRYEIYRRYE